MVHNDPLQFWAELGLPGIILFYLIIGICGFYMIRFLRQTSPDDTGRIIPVACFAALGLVLIHSHISFDLYIAAFLPVLGLVMAYPEIEPLIAAELASDQIRLEDLRALLPENAAQCGYSRLA